MEKYILSFEGTITNPGNEESVQVPGRSLPDLKSELFLKKVR
jgi:hypothetical protein